MISMARCAPVRALSTDIYACVMPQANTPRLAPGRAAIIERRKDEHITALGQRLAQLEAAMAALENE